MSLAKYRGGGHQKGMLLHSNAFTGLTETWFIFPSTFHLCKFSYNRRIHLTFSLVLSPGRRARDLIHLCHWSFLSPEKANSKLIVWIVLLQLCIIYFWGIFHTSRPPLCVSDLSLTWLIFARDEVFIPLLFSFLSITAKQISSSIHCITHHHHLQCKKC